jgi:hypothetical protein
MLHALIKNPEWLASLAKTNADLLSYQELLTQWQAAGYPDLKAWQAKESLAPLPEALGKAISISQNSLFASLTTPLSFPVEVNRRPLDQ